MAKIGLYSDLHLHLWRSFGRDKAEGLPVRFSEQIDVLNQMYSTFVAEKCGMVIDGGDGTHIDTAVPVECVNVRAWFSRRLRKAGIKEKITEGNHTLSKKSNPSWMNRSYYYLLDDDDEGDSPSSNFSYGGIKIKLVGYSDEQPVEEIEGYDLVIVHKQPVITNRFGYTYEGVDWKVLAKNNKLVFFGHYHSKVQLSENCWIMGPPMHLTFGDEGERGIWIVDTETLSVKFIKLNYPEFITVETSDQVKNDTNYYRVLNSDKKIDSERVITSVVPEFFEERIKSDDFIQILAEWAALNKKDPSWVEIIRPVVTSKMKLHQSVYKGRIFEVYIDNFFSIGSIKYSVEKGFHIITGRNSDLDSNGSGKTSMFEAIYWCLFGKTTKGNLRADEIIRDGEKDCEVKVLLLDEGGEETGDGYAVVRSKKNGLKVYECDHRVQNWREITEGKTKPECEKMLYDILGFDEKVYLSSCYFSQENILMLTGLGDADRTNMITDLLGFEAYDDLHKICSEKSKQILLECQHIGESIKTFESDSKWIKVQIEDVTRRIQDVDSQVNDKLIAIARKDEEYSVLITEAANLKAPKVDLIDIDKKITEADDALKVSMQTISDTRKALDELEQQKKALQVSESQTYTDFWSVSAKKDIYVKEIEAVNQTHSHQTGQFCSHCGSVINKENQASFLEDRKLKIRAFAEDLIILNGKHTQAKKKLEDHITTMKAVDVHIRTLQSDVDQKTIQLRESNVLKSQLQNQHKEYEVRKVSLERQIEAIRNAVQQLRSDADRIKKSKESLNLDLAAKNNQLSQLSVKITESLNELSAKQLRIEIFTFWSDAFLPSGIRAVLLDRFCNEFNRILNQYLSLVSNGTMSIVVSPTKKIAGGSERNKIGIMINNAGHERNYLALSGGEKRRVDISLCMGLNRWVSEKYSIQKGLLGVIIMDELFSFIDRLGEETIGGLLYQEGASRSIFVISHTAEIGSYTRNVWTAVKQNGITHLEIEDDYSKKN